MKRAIHGMFVLLLLLSLVACQASKTSHGGADSGGGTGGTGGSGTPDTGGRPIAFECATLSTQTCVLPTTPATASLAPFPGALTIDLGDVSISSGDTSHFSVIVAREVASLETDAWVTVIMVQGELCYGAALPASGWQWIDIWGDSFGPAGGASLEKSALYGFSCPALTPGLHQFWALIAPDDHITGTLYNAWTQGDGQGNSPASHHVSPDDPAVAPYVTHSAVITFNAVP